MKQRKRRLLLLLLLLVLGGALALGFAPVPTYFLNWWAITGGGGASSSLSYRLSGSVGQPVVGNSSSLNYRHSAGFWPGITGPTETPTPTRTLTPPPGATPTRTLTPPPGLTPRGYLPLIQKRVWRP